MINELDVDIAGIAESWFSESKPIEYFEIDNITHSSPNLALIKVEAGLHFTHVKTYGFKGLILQSRMTSK